jgi:hypothetical protein
MNYEKQEFVNGQVLTADSLNYMEDGIKGAFDAIGDIDTALDSVLAIQNSLIGGDGA